MIAKNNQHHVRFLRSIGFRVLALNVLLVFLPLAAFFFLGTYEKQLLRALEHALVQQARFLSAALTTPENGGGSTTADQNLSNRSAALLLSLEREHEARLRVFDADGYLLADSATLSFNQKTAQNQESADTKSLPYGQDSQSQTIAVREGETEALSEEEDTVEEGLLYKIGSLPIRLFREVIGPPYPPTSLQDIYAGSGPFSTSELQAALSGGYGARTRILGGTEPAVVLYSALPIREGTHIVGAVLVSQSTYKILRDLYVLRVDIFQIFLVSVVCAFSLSLVLSLSLVRPLGILSSRAAELLDHRGRIRGTFQVLPGNDELGLLSRSLYELSLGLERHIKFVESFSQDLAHEIRNPLSSLRASLELMSGTENDKERQRLLAIASRDAGRIATLITGIREISLLDTENTESQGSFVSLTDLLDQAIEGFRLRRPDRKITIEASPCPPVSLRPERLIQAVDNLLENADSFSPPESPIEVSLEVAGSAFLRIRDHGPGFPPEDSEAIFERFYSSRKDQAGHTGLGLSIVKSIARAWGGDIKAHSDNTGAVFTLVIPLGKN